MAKAERFRPLRSDAPEALGQCKKCGATMTFDLVDVLTGLLLIHKPDNDPRFKENPCGGVIKLYQEVRPNE
jgi:hypothetical protein